MAHVQVTCQACIGSLDFDKTRCMFHKDLISNMDALQDELCFILDVEGFFINKTFHVRELGYYTWN